MGVYAYCVVPAPHRPPAELTGIGGQPVGSALVEGLGIWISGMARPPATVAAVQAHNSVVEAAVTEAITPVPLRFGQWVPDEQALIGRMAEKSADYRIMLDRFAGCLEFGLRLIEPAAEQKARDVHADPGTSGLAYMHALRESSRLAEQQRQHGNAVRARVSEQLGDLVRAERVETEQTPHAVVTLSHLVARGDFDEYRDRARGLRSLFPAMRLLVSGPWPPYSFAA
jgi:ethanolamine utilization microcompartment shell protein EutS